MSQRDDWKDTGKGLGSAFKGLGKSLIRTAKTGVDMAVDWAEGKPENENEGADDQTAVQGDASGMASENGTGAGKAQDGAAEGASQSDGTESNVFNDGTWRETGKELGGAFKDLGQNIIKTAKRSGEKAGEWAEGTSEDENS